MSQPRLALRMRAFSLAMSAKTNTLRPEDIEALRRQAGSYPFPDDPFAGACLKFCTDLHHLRRARDRVGLFDVGREMIWMIDRLNRPPPPDLHRKDIHG